MAECNNRNATCKDCLHVNVCIFRNAGEDEVICRQFINKADVSEVRNGEWLVNAWDGKDWAIIPYKEGQHTDPFCSRCKEPAWRDPRGGNAKPSKHCPTCGAKMDGGNDDG